MTDKDKLIKALGNFNWVNTGPTGDGLQIIPPREANTDWNVLAEFTTDGELSTLSWTQGVADGA